MIFQLNREIGLKILMPCTILELLLFVGYNGGGNMNQSTPEIQVGGIYSIYSSGGVFKIVKVLVVDPGGIHLRLYKNKFEERPEHINPQELVLGRVFNEDNSFNSDEFSLGHAAFFLDAFLQSNPILLMVVPVMEDELDGYRMWEDAQGGYFDGMLP